MTSSLNDKLYTPAHTGGTLNTATVGKGSAGAGTYSNDSFEKLLNRQTMPDAAQAINDAIQAPAANSTSDTADATPSLSTPYTGRTAGDLLNKAKTTTTDDTAADRHKAAEKGAASLVSNALILPILKQLRRSPFGENKVFSGGKGEKTFGPAFDMEIADRISQSPRLGIKEALADRLEQRGHPAKAAASVTKASNGLDVHG